MPVTAVCGCGKSYTLKDDFAGESIECPACGSAFTVPASKRVAQAEAIFERDKFLVKQKRVAISAQYYIADDSGKDIAFAHRPLALVQMMLLIFVVVIWVFIALLAGIVVADAVLGRAADQNAITGVSVGFVLIGAGILVIFRFMAPKRHVTFYRSQQMTERLMTVRQDFRFAITRADYSVLDKEGQTLAVLRKNYLYNVIRKRWYISDGAGRPLCIAIEDSILLSILRRYAGSLLGLLRTNFVIMTPDFQTVLGEFNRKLTLFDKYVLDLTSDPDRTLDRRVALALGVMLDTGESR